MDQIKKIVVIGASTGGPPIVESILTRLPEDIDVPVLVVQHMPKTFTGSFAKRLDKLTKIKVKEAEDGEQVNKGVAYIARGGKHMRIKKEGKDKYYIKLTQETAIFGLRPAIDITLDSVASAFREKCLVAILTGMGKDGTEGAKKVKDEQGEVVVQDPAKATISSMPQSVIDAGMADEILDTNKMVIKIIKFSKDA